MKKALKITLIVLTIIVSSVLIYCFYDFLFIYHMKLNGNNEIVIDVNSNYNDPGVELKYRGKKINDYNIDSNLDTNKIGNYTINYSKGKTKLSRKVIVEDLDNPNIELIGEEELKITYKDKYIEPGYKANDNYDGDLTNKVKVTNNIDTNKLGQYEVKYEVMDNHNNKVEKIRRVNVIDDIKSTLKFKSNTNSYLILGKKIKLNDFTAEDNYDGNLNDKVIIEGKVNNKKSGIYKIKYKVKDSSNNETSLEKIVNVQEKNTNGIPVLMYHWFYDDTKGEKPTGANQHNFIAKSELIKQVKYLVHEKYYFPTWQELIDYIDGKIDLPKKSIIITDDDCVDSFFKIALPVFEEYKVPVTSFCITKKSNWKKYIGKEYLDFESHTDSMHVRKCKNWTGAVMCSSYEDIYNDLKTSVSKVKNKYAFAYPFGHHSENTIKALKNNGIKLAFTINYGRVRKHSNKYLLPRVRISKSTTINQFKNLVK